MADKLTGAIYTYETHALYVGALVASARHRHHAGQLLWAPDAVEVTSGEEPPRRAILHIVPPHQWHSHAGATMAAVLWVDREDVCWDRIPAALPQHLDAEVTRADARALADSLLALVTPLDARAPADRHPAVVRMREMLDANAGEDDIRVGPLARQSGLSVRQLRHRFTEQVGVNPSGYLRWRRLRHAIAAIERGASLTRGALEGGFADGAHFSRVFQAQFGIAPSRALTSLGRR